VNYFRFVAPETGKWTFSIVDGTPAAEGNVTITNPQSSKQIAYLSPGRTLVAELVAGQEYVLEFYNSEFGEGVINFVIESPVVLNELKLVALPQIPASAATSVTIEVTDPVTSPAASSFTYQWLRDGVEIPDATAETYRPWSSDIGKSLSVRVTAKLAGYPDLVTVSNSTSAVTQTVVPCPLDFELSGWPPKVGQTISVSSFGPCAGGTYTFNWWRWTASRSFDKIIATGPTYTPTADDYGYLLSFQIQVNHPDYIGGSATNTQLYTVQPGTGAITSVIVSGNAAVGSLLTATPTGVVPTGAPVSYQWLRDGVAIPGATGQQYTVQTTDSGKQISVTATVNATGYTTATATAIPVKITMPLAWETNTLTVTDVAQTVQVGVNSSCAPWTVSDTVSWTTLSPVSGANSGTVSIKLTANTSTTADRTAVVKLSGCGETADLQLTQTKKPTLTLSRGVWLAANTAASVATTVTTNQSVWKTSTSVSWLTADPTSGNAFTITAEPNPGAIRTGTVSVTAGGLTKNINVTQLAATFIPSPTAVTLAASGAMTSIRLTTTYGTWTLDPSSLPDWLKASHTSGGTGESVVLYAVPNTGAARSADISFTAGELTKTVRVTQSVAPAATLTTVPTTWAAPLGVGEVAIKVTTNQAAWQASVDASWVHLNKTSDGNGGYLIAGTDPNPTSATRTAKITFTAGTYSRTFTITQAAGPGTFSSYDYPMPPLLATAGSTYWTTGWTGTGTLSVTDNVSWLTVSVNNGVVLATATANTGAVRLATVTLYSGTKVVATKQIVQSGPLSIASGAESFAVAAAGGTMSRTVTLTQGTTLAPGSWRVYTDASWLHLVDQPFPSGITLIAAAERNETGVSRTGYITIAYPGGTKVLTVSQTK
jgi:hypothetical protein